MTRLPTLLARIAAALVVGSALVLGGCHKQGVKSQQQLAAQWEGKFDATIESYKDGQFLIDGAVLSAVDAGSHFAYLRDIHKLPKTVLLMPSSDSKIRKVHLQYLARMSIDYGFAAYYDNDGQITQINAVNTKARELKDHHTPMKIEDSQQCKSAAGCDRMDQQSSGQRGY
ncbi:MAG: hypothetical protein EPN56_13070 [Rhodanobacter sp.]|nr:MAG: hypothetical protein EPN78_10400 [Rhodanobacter sp.]TAM12114.1 MAG: hypothetical protein EPN66_07800 [Rhodanobacter sp.]TAM34545.1 MAG: hypothetical protein EPN56_13070 [Rhodanobacter sp.]